MGDEVHFLSVNKHESFQQVDIITLMCVARHVQRTQNNISATSLRYFKKEVSGEVNILHVDSH